jgi:methyl-accepting chemotaxis protein
MGGKMVTRWARRISTMSVRKKLYGGFLSVVVVFLIAAVYQVAALDNLKIYQAQEANRNEEAMRVKDILRNVDTCYTTILQAILNRDIIIFAGVRKDLTQLKAKIDGDIVILKTKAHTREEREGTVQLGQTYARYLDLIENKMLPQLEKGNSGNIDDIRDIEQELDAVRENAGSGLESINKSYVKRAKEWDGKFKSVARRAKTMLFAITALSFLLAGGIALFIVRGVLTSLGADPSVVVEIAQQISDGDLTMTIDSKGAREGSLIMAFARMVDKLQSVISQIRAAADEMASASLQLSSSAEQLAEGSNEQMEKSQQTAVASEEMTRTITGVANNTASIASASQETARTAKEGAAVVERSVDEVKQIAQMVGDSAGQISSLGNRSIQIGDIVNVINDIADQTNLLALNAAIEAARAGEHGRGFAVVADEVRKLAEKTASSTHEIGGMIRGIRRDVEMAVSSMGTIATKVDAGVALSEKAGISLAAIVSAADKLDLMIQDITAATEEMATTSEQITNDSDVLRNGASESALATGQVSAVAHELAAHAGNMQRVVGGFRI